MSCTVHIRKYDTIGYIVDVPLSNNHFIQDERKKPEATVASSRGKKGPTRKSARNRAQEEEKEQEEHEEKEVAESPKKSPEKAKGKEKPAKGQTAKGRSKGDKDKEQVSVFEICNLKPNC